MFLNQLLCEVQVQEDDIEDVFVGVVALETLLQILKVSDHARLLVDGRECLTLLQLVDYHHLEWLLLIEYELVVMLALEQLNHCLIRAGQHELALVVRVGEHALWNSPIVQVFIVEELLCVN